MRNIESASAADSFGDAELVDIMIAELQADRPVGMCSLLDSHGSMPRHEGCRLVVLADDTLLGTVGGGRIEQLAINRTRSCMRGEEPASVTWETQKQTGMACGGDALLSVRRFTTEDLPQLERLAEALSCEVPSWAMEDWSTPEAPTLKVVSQFIDDETTPETPRWNEQTACFVEPVGPAPRCYVFGGGHVGRALVPVLASVGFRVTVYDDRADVAVPQNFKEAEQVIYGSFLDISEHVTVTKHDYVVCLTYGHVADIDVLEQVCGIRPVYVGCIGSRHKAAFARKTLVKRGVNPDDVAAIHLPIGLDIFAVTPAEIAVAIAGEMIACRARRRSVLPHTASTPEQSARADKASAPAERSVASRMKLEASASEHHDCPMHDSRA